MKLTAFQKQFMYGICVGVFINLATRLYSYMFGYEPTLMQLMIMIFTGSVTFGVVKGLMQVWSAKKI